MSDKHKEDLYNTGKGILLAKERIKEDKGLLPEQQKLILEMDKHHRARGISLKRRKKYLCVLTILLRKMGRPLKGAGNKELQEIVTWIEEGGIRKAKNKKTGKIEDTTPWSEATKEDYKQVLKYSWRFANGYDREDHPKEVRFIKSRNVVTPPKWLPSETQVLKAINLCLNPRDKFIIAALREGGFRTGEMCYMNLEDWREEGELVEVNVPEHGKTGARSLYMHDVIPYYKEWLAAHPARSNPDAPLVVNLEGQAQGERMKPHALLKAVKNAFKRAGVERNVSVQLLRKRNSTEMAGKLNAQELNDRQGWVQGSKMAGYYVRFSKKHKKRVAKQLYGIGEEEEDVERTIKCINPLCGEINPADRKFCYKCHSALNVDAAMEVKKLRDQINKDQAEFYRTGDLAHVLSRIEARIEALEEAKK